LGGNVSSKLSNKIKYSNISYVTKDNVLQRIEQMFLNHLGNNYFREIMYSHYGSWIPKYGFFNTNETLNPKNFSKFSIENLNIMDSYIESGDWVKYFEFKNSLKKSRRDGFYKKIYIY
jgi:hypothetical protein